MTDHIFLQISLPIGNGKLPDPTQKTLAQMRARELKEQFEAIGFAVLNPFEFPCRHDWNYADNLAMCKYMMFAFRPIMFFDRGWKDSEGCRQEWEEADKLKLHVRQFETGDLENLRREFAVMKDNKSYYQLHTSFNL